MQKKRLTRKNVESIMKKIKLGSSVEFKNFSKTVVVEKKKASKFFVKNEDFVKGLTLNYPAAFELVWEINPLIYQ